jgi:hypothetical protein
MDFPPFSIAVPVLMRPGKTYAALCCNRPVTISFKFSHFPGRHAMGVARMTTPGFSSFLLSQRYPTIIKEKKGGGFQL